MSKTVLVVEDYGPLFRAISQKFSRSDVVCLNAQSVIEAQELMMNHPEISLIWLDHLLLGAQVGLDFLRNLRESEKHKKIPVIVVSNETNLDKVAEYKALGVRHYFVKIDHTLAEIVDEALTLMK